MTKKITWSKKEDFILGNLILKKGYGNWMVMFDSEVTTVNNKTMKMGKLIKLKFKNPEDDEIEHRRFMRKRSAELLYRASHQIAY